jgi:hypothetical protein
MTSAASDIEVLKTDVSLPFSRERFSMERRPVKVGEVALVDMETDLHSCLDMLVKIPGGETVIPAAYNASFVRQLVDRCMAFEDSILSSWRDTHYVYLTVDQRKIVPGKTHRNAGWHFDGMQGARYPQKLSACHQYVLSSALPTEFATQAVDATGLDELTHNWFVELGAQVSDDRNTVIRPNVGDVMLMSAYQLHRSPVAPNDADFIRTFVRIDVSLKQQDRVGNTLNPELKAPFDFHERSLPEGLKYSINDSGWRGGRKL